MTTNVDTPLATSPRIAGNHRTQLGSLGNHIGQGRDPTYDRANSKYVRSDHNVILVEVLDPYT